MSVYLTDREVECVLEQSMVIADCLPARGGLVKRGRQRTKGWYSSAEIRVTADGPVEMWMVLGNARTSRRK